MGRRAIFALGLALDALACIACGKERLDGSERAPGAGSGWDPPTAEHGFQPVATVSCMPFDAGPNAAKVTMATEETVEDVALATAGRRVPALAADRLHVYWAETGETGESGDIFAASRPDSRGPWIRERIAAAEEPLDLAATDGQVFWTDARGGVRVYDGATHAVTTVAIETQAPGRVVADGAHVFWIAPPNHLREAHREAKAGIPGGGLLEPSLATFAQAPDWKVKSLLTMTTKSDLLAVDREAAFVFTIDGALVRVPRSGATSHVIVSPSGTAPVDMAVHDGWVYWLDEGREIARCRRGLGCERGYYNPNHPAGVFRRVRTAGGPVEVVAEGLPDVQKLAFLGDDAWIATADGPMRVAFDVSGEHRIAHVTRQPVAPGPARYASIGAALVLGVGPAWKGTRIVLLSPP